MEKNNINVKTFDAIRNLADQCRKETSKRIIGQESVIDGILTTFIAGGHVLLEGVPGLAKTLVVKTFSEIAGLDFKRIQFTPDLLPADVTGTLIYEQSSGSFTVRKGPVFTNIVLADEINRAPAKVQSALLEAMEEHQVTIGEKTHNLPDPFFVLATQNPIEQEGTYNLPEAELDRFLMKIVVPYPSQEDEINIVKTAGNAPFVPVKQIFSAEILLKCRKLVDQVICDDKLIEYIVSIISVTRPVDEKNIADTKKIILQKSRSEIMKYILFGASPRAGIALIRSAKASALLKGRSFVLPEDVRDCALSVLRHRLILSYEAAADGVTVDHLISRIMQIIPVP